MQNETVLREEQPAVLYFSEAEGQEFPELLLFEEKVIRDSKWKRASRKGQRLWQRIREIYDLLTVDFFATDRFVRRLKSFRKITVLLNKPIDPAVVRSRLRQLLKERSYHHLRWLIADALLLPLSLFAAPLPGPNVWGYYLLFRVYSHWKSYRSTAVMKLDQVDVLVSDRAEEVTRFFRGRPDIKTGLHELRRKYGLRALQEQEFLPQVTKIKRTLRRLKRHLQIR